MAPVIESLRAYHKTQQLLLDDTRPNPFAGLGGTSAHFPLSIFLQASDQEAAADAMRSLFSIAGAVFEIG